MSRGRAILLGSSVFFLLLLSVWGLTDVRKRASWNPDDPSRHRTDITVYTAAGKAIRDGENPYEATNPRGWHYLYPPLFAILVAPLADLDPQWQGVIWFFLSLLLAVGCVYEGHRIVRLLPRPGPRILAWAWTCAILAALFPTLNTLQRGQIGIAVGYPLMLGFRLLISARGKGGWIGSGIVLALPVALKVTPALPVVVLGWWETVRAFRAKQPEEPGARRARLGWATTGLVAGVLLYFILVPSIVTGWSANNRHLRQWVDEIAASGDLREGKSFNPYSIRNQSLENAVRRFRLAVAARLEGNNADTDLDMPQEWRVAVETDPPAVRYGLLAVRGLGILLLLWAVWRLAPAGGMGAHAAIFGLACVLSLMVSPISWGHHYVLLLPAVLFVTLRVGAANRPSAARVFAGTGAGLSLLHYAVLKVAGRLGLLGIGTMLWFFGAVGAVLAARDAPDAE